MGRNSVPRRRARKAAEAEKQAAKTPEAPKLERDVLKSLDENQRALIDPQVRRVQAMKMQVTEAGQQVDLMLTLLYPAFERGDVLYDPATGEFFRPKAGKKQPAPQDPTEAPVKSLGPGRTSGRKGA